MRKCRPDGCRCFFEGGRRILERSKGDGELESRGEREVECSSREGERELEVGYTVLDARERRRAKRRGRDLLDLLATLDGEARRSVPDLGLLDALVAVGRRYEAWCTRLDDASTGEAGDRVDERKGRAVDAKSVAFEGRGASSA